MVESNVQVLLTSRPEGLPRTDNFRVVDEPLGELAAGQVRVRNVYLSLDPAMRGWMSDRKSYVPPVALGAVMRGLTSGVVTASNDPAFSPGDLVSGVLGWQLYADTPGRHLNRLPAGTPLTLALGPLGMVGMTAYFGLLDIGRPQPGETVFVSAAAGAVGSLVGQIARIHGCRVVGTAGSDDKCRWILEELGFDAAINYRTVDDLHQALRQACPDGIDVYFDNVGGETLDTALRLINRKARVVLCGAISQYNATESVPGPSNYLALLVQRARMEGFIVMDYQDQYGKAIADISGWLSSGELRYREHVVDGLEEAPRALLKLFDGSHSGKLMVRLGAEP